MDEILRICKIWHKRKSNRWLKLGGCWVSVKELVLWWLFSVVDCLIFCVLSQPQSIRFSNYYPGAAVNTEKNQDSSYSNVGLYFNLRFLPFHFVVILLAHPSTLALKLPCTIQGPKITRHTNLKNWSKGKCANFCFIVRGWWKPHHTIIITPFGLF